MNLFNSGKEEKFWGGKIQFKVQGNNFFKTCQKSKNKPSCYKKISIFETSYLNSGLPIFKSHFIAINLKELQSRSCSGSLMRALELII